MWLSIVLSLLLKGRLSTDTSPQNFWTTFLDNDLTEKFKKSAVANAIAIPLPLCFSYFVPLRRFRENLIKPFYLYLSRICDSPDVTPSVISLRLVSHNRDISTCILVIISGLLRRVCITEHISGVEIFWIIRMARRLKRSYCLTDLHQCGSVCFDASSTKNRILMYKAFIFSFSNVRIISSWKIPAKIRYTSSDLWYQWQRWLALVGPAQGQHVDWTRVRSISC